MTITQPYRRTVRQHSSGTYAADGKWMYLLHPKQATNRDFYIRYYKILLKDFIDILEYIEPADINLETYSFRLRGLLMRICIEVEANFKAIMQDNGYIRSGNWNMEDYKKVDASHYLSRYEAKYPVWSGSKNLRTPFAAFSSGASPNWYRDYHAAKHDRQNEFAKANFENVVDAMAGLAILISSQFMDISSLSSPFTLAADFGPSDGYEDSIGEYIRIKYPTNIPIN